MKILDKLKVNTLRYDNETLDFYELGLFKNSSYDLVHLKEIYYVPHIHKKSSAKFYIIFGSGIIIIKGKEIKYKAGNIFNIPKGTPHGFKVKEETLFLSVQTPPIMNPKTNKPDVEYPK